MRKLGKISDKLANFKFKRGSIDYKNAAIAPIVLQMLRNRIVQSLNRVQSLHFSSEFTVQESQNRCHLPDFTRILIQNFEFIIAGEKLFHRRHFIFMIILLIILVGVLHQNRIPMRLDVILNSL
jgi:hypothetical protein